MRRVPEEVFLVGNEQQVRAGFRWALCLEATDMAALSAVREKLARCSEVAQRLEKCRHRLEHTSNIESQSLGGCCILSAFSPAAAAATATTIAESVQPSYGRCPSRVARKFGVRFLYCQMKLPMRWTGKFGRRFGDIFLQRTISCSDALHDKDKGIWSAADLSRDFASG